MDKTQKQSADVRRFWFLFSLMSLKRSCKKTFIFVCMSVEQTNSCITPKYFDAAFIILRFKENELTGNS